MINMLTAGKISALIIDTNFVLHTVGRQCDLSTVDLPFLVEDLGINVRRGVSKILVDDLDR